MPRINQVNVGREVISGGSVGRQHVGAPIEAFGGTGKGLQKLGAGVAAVGGGVQREAAQAEQEQKRKNNIAGQRAKLNFTNKLNAYVIENKDRTDIDQNSTDYKAFVDKAKQQELSAITDQAERERLSLSMDQSEASSKSVMRSRANEVMKAEEAALEQRNIDAGEEKLIVSSEELERDFNMTKWFGANGGDFLEAINTKAERLPPEQRKDYKKQQIASTMTKVFSAMSEKIATHPNPEKYTELMNALVSGAEKGGVYDSTMAKQATATINKKLGVRHANDEKKRVIASADYVNNFSSIIIDPSSTLADRELAIQEAKNRKGLFPTATDPEGNKAFARIKAYNRTYEAERNSINYSGLMETLATEGPEAARVQLDTLVEGLTVTNALGTKVQVPGLNETNTFKAQEKIEKGFDSALAPVYKELATEMRKLAEEGKLYAAELEFGAREFEPLSDKEIGDSVGVFNRATPFASDWDEHQIDKQEVDQLLDSAMAWADANNVTDSTALRRHVKELLFPIEKSAARKRFSARMRANAPARVKAGDAILDTVKK